MNERDELATVIANNSIVIHDYQYGEVTASTLTPDEMADLILAAGYTKGTHP